MSRPRGWRQSEEAKAKIREAVRARWRDPEYRERQSARLRAQQPLAIQAAKKVWSLKYPRGTPERNQYEKIREILGAAAARATL